MYVVSHNYSLTAALLDTVSQPWLVLGWGWISGEQGPLVFVYCLRGVESGEGCVESGEGVESGETYVPQ